MLLSALLPYRKRAGRLRDLQSSGLTLWKRLSRPLVNAMHGPDLMRPWVDGRTREQKRLYAVTLAKTGGRRSAGESCVARAPQRLPDEPQAADLSRDTLQHRVQRRLSDMILDGEIVPGQLITLRNLAASFGVSAMPVRGALKGLIAANALAVVSGRSVGIPALSAETLTDLRNVRQVLEGAALAWAAERADKAKLAIIDGHLDRLHGAVTENNVKEYLRSNRAFHFSIYQAAGSPALLNGIEALWLQISPYFSLLSVTGNYQAANFRHREMLDALLERNPERARKAVLGDIQDGCDLLFPLLSKLAFLNGKSALPPFTLNPLVR